MNREEKIMLHELIGKYIYEELEPEIKKRKNPVPETKTEYAIFLTMCNHVKVLEEIMETLVYDF